ncbi:helix-turn-helix domain-containing protein [Pandoraea pnomenusa]|uniref:helix-turn-helix domain-containing protein n=2 Tax=Pandoraea TaxID=93217 RepID=UPI001E5D6822|nr:MULTISPECIES: helix-turn-helix transcriptional regulator [Pandoraea]
MRLLRRAKGWSQEELAARAELDRSFVAHVERQARNVSIDNIERIASAFGIPVYSLLTPNDSVEDAGSA